MNYRIYNKKDSKVYYKTFDSYNKCYKWIIKHLDLSKIWKVDNKIPRLINGKRKLVTETRNIIINLY